MELFSRGISFVVVDELCPGKCRGKSHPTIAFGTAGGLPEQRLGTAQPRCCILSRDGTKERSGAEESKPDHLSPSTCSPPCAAGWGRERGVGSAERETGLSQGRRQIHRHRHVESRSLRRAGRSSTGSYKAWCSEVLHCAVTLCRRFSLREVAEHMWEPKEKLHSSPRGQRTVLLQEGRGIRSSKEEHCCSNSSCKASRTPPRALRLQSCSWAQQDRNLQCNSHPGFGGFLVWSLIACARCQEDTIPLCDATWEDLALLCIISWEISNFLYSHSRKLLGTQS